MQEGILRMGYYNSLSYYEYKDADSPINNCISQGGRSLPPQTILPSLLLRSFFASDLQRKRLAPRTCTFFFCL